jgi:hypothetical protein
MYDLCSDLSDSFRRCVEWVLDQADMMESSIFYLVSRMQSTVTVYPSIFTHSIIILTTIIVCISFVECVDYKSIETSAVIHHVSLLPL